MHFTLQFYGFRCKFQKLYSEIFKQKQTDFSVRKVLIDIPFYHSQTGGPGASAAV